jgi:hypothetical protein
MPLRPNPPVITPPAGATTARLVLPGATITLPNANWFQTLTSNVKLRPGAVAPNMLRVPVADAQAVLRGIIHLVADVRADAPPTVVWVAGREELLVYLDRAALACAPGLVTISLVVRCDEVKGAQRVDVAFAVGKLERPTGLVMSTFDRVQGPAVIADTWSESLTAFAWEALVTLAQQLAAGTGKDSAGRPLVPALIAADKNLLLIAAMARNNISLAKER